jgi:release factor glutamine methyltransferase
MKLIDLQKQLVASLKNAGIAAADQEARIMLEERLALSWADLIAKGDTEVESTALESDLQKRLAGMPLGRIYGRKMFYGMEFRLSPETLEPRADTEILVDIALQKYKDSPPAAILDLGTGTGCILLALLKHWPYCRGLGIDKSPEAVQTAGQNAADHGLSPRASFRCGDWAGGLEEPFDLVVSNPPYIESAVIETLSEEVKRHDPILALDGGAEGMGAYETIFSHLPAILKPGGTALFEIGYDQSRKISRLSEDHGFILENIHPDSAGRPRVAELSRTG